MQGTLREKGRQSALLRPAYSVKDPLQTYHQSMISRVLRSICTMEFFTYPLNFSLGRDVLNQDGHSSLVGFAAINLLGHTFSHTNTQYVLLLSIIYMLFYLTFIEQLALTFWNCTVSPCYIYGRLELIRYFKWERLSPY